MRGTLLERDAELGVLTGALDRAAAGDGAPLVVAGPAGIGKTRLLLAARDHARAAGFTVLRARGATLERAVAHGVVRQLLERHLAGLPADRRAAALAGPAAPAGPVVGGDAPAGDGGAAAGDPLRVPHALHWLTLNLAADGPVLLLVDDVHWADAPSLRALAYLAGRLDGSPVALLAAHRDDEPDADRTLLAELAAPPEAVVVRPRALSGAAVHTLASGAFGGDVPATFADACASATGGNPFLVSELLTALHGEGRRPEAISAAELAEAGAAAVSRTILLRLGRLPPATAALARAAAILSDGAEPRHAAALAGALLDEGTPPLSGAATRAAVDTLAAAGLVEDDRVLRFAHPLVRAAVAGDVPPATRAELHRRAAAVLAAEGARDDALLPHVLAAEPCGDAAVVALLRRTAAAALASGAPDSAAEHLARALAEPPEPAERPAVLAALGAAELEAGAFTHGHEHLRTAAELTADRIARARLGPALAAAARDVDGFPAAARVLEQARADAGDDDPALALTLEAALALTAWVAGDEHPVLPRLERSGPGGDSPAGRCVLAVLAQRACDRGEDAEAVRALACRSLAGGRLLGEDGGAASLHWSFAVYALVGGEHRREARGAIDDALAHAAHTGSVAAYAAATAADALLALQAGDGRAVEADGETILATGTPSARMIGWSYVVLGRLEQGDVAGAQAAFDEGGLAGAAFPGRVWQWPGYTRARLRLAQGRLPEALAELEPLEAIAASGREMFWPWRPFAAEVRAGLGRRDEARALAADAVARARRWGRPWRLGQALRVLAQVGPPEAREEVLREAVAVLAPSPARLELARARHDLGVALLRAGRRREGRAELEAALPLAQACGARDLAAAVRDELVVAGAAPLRLRFDELTAAERRVADLAAAGRSNREIAEALFVTPKTVENHLGRAYAKLGIASRQELAGVLAAA